MKIRFQTLFALAFIFVGANLAAVEKITYKWTDDSGEVHYTERAPKDREYTKIRTFVSKKNASTNKVPVLDNNDKAVKKKDSYGTWRDENCTIANQNLDILVNAGRISTADGEGGKRLMTDEEKKEKITQMEKQRDKYCQDPEKK